MELNLVAYSCENLYGLFHKSCAVGNLLIAVVFYCAVPIHLIACLNKYGGL